MMSAHARGFVDDILARGLATPASRILSVASHGGHLAPFFAERGLRATILEGSPVRAARLAAGGSEVMVGTLDSLSLKNTKLGLETLGLMEYDKSKIQLVLNRADTRVGISQHDVVAVLGSEPNIFIPSDREIPRSVNEGIPIILSRPQSYAAASFHDLAGLFLTNRPSANGSDSLEAAGAAPQRATRSLFRFKRK